MNFPFKFKPEAQFVNIGDEKSGIIEVESFNDITIAEQIEFETGVRELGSETKPVVDLITLISKEQAINFELAQGILFGREVVLPNNKEPNSIRMRYSDELLNLNMKLLPIQKGKQLIGASLMVRRAIKPLEAFVEKLQDNLKTAKSNEEKSSLIKQIEEYEKQIASLKNWTIEESKKVFRQSTLKVLYEFFLKESNGGKMPEVEEVDEDVIARKEDQTIETMGKLVVEEEPKQIGEKSITESKTISPAKKDSPGKTSQTTPEA